MATGIKDLAQLGQFDVPGKLGDRLLPTPVAEPLDDTRHAPTTLEHRSTAAALA
jgi:hypothetical protein